MLAVATAGVLRPRPLLSSELQHLSEKRFVAVPRWLAAAEVAWLQADAMAVDARIGVECQVGSTDRRLALDERRSRQCSLLRPPPPNAAGSTDLRAALVQAVHALRCELQSTSVQRLPRLEPFETELNYLLYPRGGHYVRHLDQPYASSGWERQGRTAWDGGSFSGFHTRRVISFILCAPLSSCPIAAVIMCLT